MTNQKTGNGKNNGNSKNNGNRNKQRQVLMGFGWVWVEKRVSPLRSAMKLRCFGRNDGVWVGGDEQQQQQ